jgi:hypothetical protein
MDGVFAIETSRFVFISEGVPNTGLVEFVKIAMIIIIKVIITIITIHVITTKG